MVNLPTGEQLERLAEELRHTKDRWQGWHKCPRCEAVTWHEGDRCLECDLRPDVPHRAE